MDVQQAYEELQTAKNYFAPMDSRTMKIDNVTIAYWIEATDIGQDYVAPVYVFRGTCLDKTGKQLKQSFIHVIEALK
jgi:hypothetical protein